MRPAPIRPTGTTSGRAARALLTRLRKRRCLAEAGPPRGIELVFEAIALPLQPIPFPHQIALRTLGALQLLA